MIGDSQTYIETELANKDEYISQFDVRDDRFDRDTIKITPTVIHFK
jgi:hypothetical protein